MSTVDLTKYDNGIVELLRELIMIIGTTGIEQSILTNHGYVIEPNHPNLALKNFNYGREIWGVCYRRQKCPYLKTCERYQPGDCTRFFDLMSIYRQEVR